MRFPQPWGKIVYYNLPLLGDLLRVAPLQFGAKGFFSGTFFQFLKRRNVRIGRVLRRRRHDRPSYVEHTDMQEKVKARLRESRLLSPSGRG